MPLPLAHLGHWWAYILYAVPLAVVIVSIVVTTRQDRRVRMAEDQAAAQASDDEGEGGSEVGR